MRFIFNFIFFGILFYLIWLAFPDAFRTMVGWADQIVAYFREIIMDLWSRYGQNPTNRPSNPQSPTEPRVALMALAYFFNKF